MIKGYKMFDPDWTCRDFQYKVGETYEMDRKVKCGERGFHFCKKLSDCFTYCGFNPQNKVAIVTALGDVDSKGNMSCTNKIRIDEELTWSEVMDLVNVGGNNEGIGNTGSNNEGNHNSGSHNSGYCNSGSSNSGCFNSGRYNEGSFNTGDFNLSEGNTGCFNTKQHTIFMFDKPTNWTVIDWRTSGAKNILYSLMGSEDKQQAWDELDEYKKCEILNLPNFDPKIFYKVTGIKV